ncbi:hypothetical protein, partial [Mycoplasmoides pirum]|uniref:hypothetical protein n=1 Tax=Mycoplasmoides pirum TaxID=2122 RepID=UPI00138AF2CD
RFNTAICYSIAKKLHSINMPNGDILNLSSENWNKIYKIKIKDREKIEKQILKKIDIKINLYKKYKNNLKTIPI